MLTYTRNSNRVKKTPNELGSSLLNDLIVLKNHYIRSGRCAVQGSLLKALSALSFSGACQRVPDVYTCRDKASCQEGDWLFCCPNVNARRINLWWMAKSHNLDYGYYSKTYIHFPLIVSICQALFTKFLTNAVISIILVKVEKWRGYVG